MAVLLPLAVRTGMRDIGEHLAAWRKLQGLSVAALSERCGVSASTITRVEKGKGASLDNVLIIARGLGIMESVTEAFDPWNHERGRALLQSHLPQRIRD
ncbi:MAG: helix-turn-helix transcriptional regulator [Dermatophilus congolensis]|nr:helix-turn-helix transcriptional regulator [Dermatophilus congolensis]